jgi:hypothetical protein
MSFLKEIEEKCQVQGKTGPNHADDKTLKLQYF